jgi:predicted DNA-binding transcriptional regulator AlpA
MPVNGLLTIQDVSRMLGVKVHTLYMWRRTRQGPHSFKVGGAVRYRLETIENWIRQQEEKSQ